MSFWGWGLVVVLDYTWHSMFLFWFPSPLSSPSCGCDGHRFSLKVAEKQPLASIFVFFFRSLYILPRVESNFEINRHPIRNKNNTVSLDMRLKFNVQKGDLFNFIYFFFVFKPNPYWSCVFFSLLFSLFILLTVPYGWVSVMGSWHNGNPIVLAALAANI